MCERETYRDQCFDLELMGSWTLSIFLVLLFQIDQNLMETGFVSVLKWKDEEAHNQV